jgi:hypothetical protein
MIKINYEVTCDNCGKQHNFTWNRGEPHPNSNKERDYNTDTWAAGTPDGWIRYYDETKRLGDSSTLETFCSLKCFTEKYPKWEGFEGDTFATLSNKHRVWTIEEILEDARVLKAEAEKLSIDK